MSFLLHFGVLQRWVISHRFLPLWVGLGLLLFLGGSIKSLASPAQLTVTERAYLSVHPQVSFCVNPDWLPFEGLNANQEHIGIVADLMTLLANKTGLNIVLYPTHTWEESIQASKDGRCLAISSLNATPEREKWLIFTEPLLEDPNVLITRDEHPFISDVSSLNNTSIALLNGSNMAEMFAQDFPNLKIVYTENEDEGTQLVSEGKVDLTVRSLIVAARTLKSAGWYNLKVSGQLPGYENHLRIGVIKSEETLRNILNRGIASISPQETQAILDRHLNLQVTQEVITDYSFAYLLGALLLAVIITSSYWMRRLNALNERLNHMAHTDALTQLTNRNGLNLKNEVERAQRYQHPLSIILFDIDHFKKVNDNYGHLVGDQVLVELSQLLKNNLRQVDIICRWGGEEFLVICFETNLEQTVHLAELLIDKVRHHYFKEVGEITISGGVAQVQSTDSAESLTKRADDCLYEAKRAGRDRVHFTPPTA
ncbi:diguanylate cyclase [Oceanisphaera avium]|uniref:diguanylate cyclase n=1 Tax=Oceanisphaera avium TaxID=1903694 RepID=A0A1Y0CXF2_9GAMM|nr:diguanylate cyclase [Oceanisphaera avium]ART79979.1 hypothetical protein CBP12_07340 [Oceanisphaera avium]